MQVIKVKANTIFPTIIELLNSGQTVRITVTGNSMSPFLKEGRDSVALSRTSFSDLKRGDIVLIKRRNGIYVLHRVYQKKKDSFYIVGDAQQWIEGPLSPAQLIGKVVLVKRKSKEIPCTKTLWVFLSLLWLRVRVFRYLFFKANALFKKIMRITK